MPQTIVVPLDTSEGSEVAVQVAAELARLVNGRVQLVSVIEAPSEFGVWLRANETIDRWVDHHIDVERYLSRVATGISDLPVETLVTTGNPAVEINLVAQDHPDPVIVMASHARTGISRYAIGSVTASVLHDTRCPVVVVRTAEAGAKAAPPVDFGRMLVALDGSEFAEQALSSAQAVLEGATFDIHLLRVVETTKWYGSTVASIDYAAVDLYIEAAREEAEQYLSRQARKLEASGHTVTTEVRDGAVASHIVDAARDANAGLIVMATHGRTGLGRVFIGSVAEQVIHDADRPVLLVNPHGRDG